MRLLSLEVANYRNIAAAQLEPGRELTVVAADHGQLPARFQLRCRNIAVIRNFQ